MRERGTLLAAVCSHCAVSLKEERLLHSRPSIYAERREGRIGKGRDKRYGGTDRHTDVDGHQLVSKCFPLGLHTSCDAVTLSIVPSDSFVFITWLVSAHPAGGLVSPVVAAAVAAARSMSDSVS